MRSLAFIVNGIASKKSWFYKIALPSIRPYFNVEVFETRAAGDATRLASEASERKKFDAIIAAGGDGTINQVVNGMLRPGSNDMPTPVMGILPLGSGNDFARVIGATRNLHEFTSKLRDFESHTVDVGFTEFKDFNGRDASRYFINVADVGMGPMVVDHVARSPKFLGGAFAYYLGILKTFSEYRLVSLRCETSEWNWSGLMRSLAVANGRYYGHGLCIAPDALIDDGKLDVFICGNVSILDFINSSSDLKKGRHLKLPEVSYRTATTVRLSSSQRCLLETDGEVVGTLPATITMSHRSIRVLK